MARHGTNVPCCCFPEQGQAALLGEWHGEEGGLAERLARLRQRAHGDERHLPRVRARYDATIPVPTRGTSGAAPAGCPGPGTHRGTRGIPLLLQHHGPCPSIPAAPGTSGLGGTQRLHPKIISRYQDFLILGGTVKVSICISIS